MSRASFARSIGVPKTTIARWDECGYLVRTADGEIDAEASKARIIEKNGSLRPMTKSQASRQSAWSKGPHCKTHAAKQAWRGARNG